MSGKPGIGAGGRGAAPVMDEVLRARESGVVRDNSGDTCRNGPVSPMATDSSRLLIPRPTSLQLQQHLANSSTGCYFPFQHQEDAAKCENTLKLQPTAVALCQSFSGNGTSQPESQRETLFSPLTTCNKFSDSISISDNSSLLLLTPNTLSPSTPVLTSVPITQMTSSPSCCVASLPCRYKYQQSSSSLTFPVGVLESAPVMSQAQSFTPMMLTPQSPSTVSSILSSECLPTISSSYYSQTILNVNPIALHLTTNFSSTDQISSVKTNNCSLQSNGSLTNCAYVSNSINNLESNCAVGNTEFIVGTDQMRSPVTNLLSLMINDKAEASTIQLQSHSLNKSEPPSIKESVKIQSQPSAKWKRHSYFLQKDLSFIDYDEESTSDSSYIVHKTDVGDNQSSSQIANVVKSAGIYNVDLWLTAPPSAAASGEESNCSAQGYDTVAASELESDTVVAESVEEWEDDDVASLVGEPFQYDEYEPVSDVEEVLDINQSDSEVDTKFIMTAIMCDDDSLMSDDEFADQSCMDSEDDITGGLGMAEFFVAFKHHHHNRATAFTGMLSGTPSESESDFDADRWKCIECNTANNRSFFRYCEKCWKIRRDWIPDPPTKRKKKARHRPRRRRSSKNHTVSPPVASQRKLGQKVNKINASAISDFFSNNGTGDASPQKAQGTVCDGPSTSGHPRTNSAGEAFKLRVTNNIRLDVTVAKDKMTKLDQDSVSKLNHFTTLAHSIQLPEFNSEQELSSIKVQLPIKTKYAVHVENDNVNPLKPAIEELEFQRENSSGYQSSICEHPCKPSHVPDNFPISAVNRSRSLSTASTVILGVDLDTIDGSPVEPVYKDQSTGKFMIDRLLNDTQMNGIQEKTDSFDDTHLLSTACHASMLLNSRLPPANDFDRSSEDSTSASMPSAADSGMGSSQDLLDSFCESKALDEPNRYCTNVKLNGNDNQEMESDQDDTLTDSKITLLQRMTSIETNSDRSDITDRGTKRSLSEPSNGIATKKMRGRSAEEQYLKQATHLLNVENGSVPSTKCNTTSVVTDALVKYFQSNEGKAWLVSSSGQVWNNSANMQAALATSLSGNSNSSARVLCMLCEERPKDTTIIHGKTSHQATCYKCAKTLFDRKQRCPVCRRKILRICKNIIV